MNGVTQEIYFFLVGAMIFHICIHVFTEVADILALGVGERNKERG